MKIDPVNDDRDEQEEESAEESIKDDDYYTDDFDSKQSRWDEEDEEIIISAPRKIRKRPTVSNYRHDAEYDYSNRESMAGTRRNKYDDDETEEIDYEPPGMKSNRANPGRRARREETSLRTNRHGMTGN